MSKELGSIFDAATEAEILGEIDLPKIKIVLEELCDAIHNYAKHDEIFAQVGDYTIMHTFADIAFDYTIDAIKRLDSLSEFLCDEHRNSKTVKLEIDRVA